MPLMGVEAEHALAVRPGFRCFYVMRALHTFSFYSSAHLALSRIIDCLLERVFVCLCLLHDQASSPDDGEVPHHPTPELSEAIISLHRRDLGVSEEIRSREGF
jgi:hypothetical protein